MRLEELGTTERQLWHSYARGHRVAPRPATPRGPRPSVRAEFLAALLLGAGPEPGPGERPALRLDGVSVTGTLDLEFAEVAAPVALTDCHFDEAPLLRGAQFRELVLSDCVLPGLSADTVQVRGRMVLSHCRLSGPLVLTRAEIHSDLDLRRTVITAPGRDAVRAVRLSTGGDLLCTGLTVHGLTRVTGAVVAGEFDLEGAHLSNPGGTALDAYHVHVTEDFTFHPGFRSEGRLILSGAQVAAALGFCGARLSNPGDIKGPAVQPGVLRPRPPAPRHRLRAEDRLRAPRRRAVARPHADRRRLGPGDDPDRRGVQGPQPPVTARVRGEPGSCARPQGCSGCCAGGTPPPSPPPLAPLSVPCAWPLAPPPAWPAFN
jgi:hypothetical protein